MLRCSVMPDSLQPHGPQPARLLWKWNFSGKNAGVGFRFLLQEIFLTQGSNLRLLCILQWQAASLPLDQPEKPVVVCVHIHKKGKGVSLFSWESFIWVMVWFFHTRWSHWRKPRSLIGKKEMLSFTSRSIYKSCLAAFSLRTSCAIYFGEIETICWHLKILRNTTGVCKKTHKYNQIAENMSTQK